MLNTYRTELFQLEEVLPQSPLTEQLDKSDNWVVSVPQNFPKLPLLTYLSIHNLT